MHIIEELVNTDEDIRTLLGITSLDIISDVEWALIPCPGGLLMAVIPMTTEGIYHFKMISLKVNIEKIDVLTSILRVEHHSTHYFRPADPKFHLRNGEAR